MAPDNIQDDSTGSRTVYLNIPPRFYHVPGTAVIVGAAIGLVRGTRTASLRFLAENVHRPPTTVEGWYFYNKTKNYKVMLGGLKGGGTEGARLALVALGWVSIEEGLQRMGWDPVKEFGAAIGTAAMFSTIYRLPWRTTRQTMILGIFMGAVLKGLGTGRERLEVQAVSTKEVDGRAPLD
ncbi:hypothetical protein AMATHDRAFT_139493 [Amanita thiersii Skay4041]|uniref:Uncharacterized protein n=1 Tax=Amanita thiersii Skay4041 TaxID=703135 RepID=A0A2A9NRF6_9AGAR|nr:hypothetical protein AMATHDRAFT_139493 [Amanita thiersii Skay4041]